VKPAIIFIGGKELDGWTEMSLRRAKEDMTGSLEVSIFFTYMPEKPVAIDATKNKEITVYIGGHLAFTGKVDKRKGSGTKHGGEGSDDNSKASAAATDNAFSRSASIGADEYTVKISARGKTKLLIDSSHQHPTTNMLKPTTKEAIEKLIEPWGIDLDWIASTFQLDKVRFRDGAKVVDELHRLCTENGYFIYETRDGKLKIVQTVSDQQGEPLILGQNVMSFSAEQSEEEAKSNVKVKGQRTDKKVRGEKAVLKLEKEIHDKWVEGYIAYTVQHYGDATPEALERRANFETNKRSGKSKTLTIDVFHVQSSNGEPWDIGTLHYCEIPPEGIYDVFEVTELTYHVQNDKKISTTLTLSPPPASTSGASSGAGKEMADQGLGGLGGIIDEAGGALLTGMQVAAAARRAAAGITFAPGQYPAPWSGPDVSIVPIPSPADIAAIGTSLLSGLDALSSAPVATLPEDYGAGEQ
jgi:prophage tail gpP-like protein